MDEGKVKYSIKWQLRDIGGCPSGGGMVVENSDYCRRCGSAVYGFSKKMSASDGCYYCTRCAEHLDKKYLIENTCSVCARSFSKSDVKFVMPSIVYSTSPLPLAKRLVCTNCYRRFATKNKIKTNSASQWRLGFRHNMTRNFAQSIARIRN